MIGKRVPPAALFVAAATTLVLLAPAASAHSSPQARRAARGGPGVWTKIATIDNGFDYPGILRTADGKLHVVWRKHLSNGHYAYGYSNVALNGAMGGTGTVLNNWEALEEDPDIVHDGGGMRLLFKGGQDTNPANFFGRGSVYTLTSSAAGTAWSLQHVSVMQHTALNGSFSATAEQDDTPVAVAALNAQLFIHEGTDSAAPAAAADTTVTLSSGDYFNQSAATASNGSVWVAYFRSFSNPTSLDGYYVQQIFPSKGQPMKAPASTPKPGGDNEPRQAVAMIARPQGGVYLAY
ncbi:MAG TPA: hypothetical protein VID47_12555, partial [Actinomycetota bacterium]